MIVLFESAQHRSQQIVSTKDHLCVYCIYNTYSYIIQYTNSQTQPHRVLDEIFQQLQEINDILLKKKKKQNEERRKLRNFFWIYISVIINSCIVFS